MEKTIMAKAKRSKSTRLDSLTQQLTHIIDKALHQVTTSLGYASIHTRRSILDLTLPVYRELAAEELETKHKRFESGDKASLFAAIRICAEHELPLPAWASRAFITAYDGMQSQGFRSWDDAFGKPLPKGKQLASMRNEHKRAKVLLALIKAREGGHAIDEGLFESIGKKFGINKTLITELLYGKPTQKITVAEQLSGLFREMARTLRKYKR